MFSMHDSIHDYCFSINLEQHPIITDAQAILRGKIGKALDVASQPSIHFSKSSRNSSRVLLLQPLQILDGLWLEFDFHLSLCGMW